MVRLKKEKGGRRMMMRQGNLLPWANRMYEMSENFDVIRASRCVEPSGGQILMEYGVPDPLRARGSRFIRSS